jgi:hypothetical protein
VTLTEKLQEELEARVAALREIVFVPGVAVMVPPPQEPVRTLGVERSKPAGNVSVKAMLVRVVEGLGFEAVKLSEVAPLSGMLAVPKEFASVGGAITVTEALEVFPVPPWAEVMVTLLFFAPGVVPVTLRVRVQEALEDKVPAEKLMALDAGTAVVVPMQVVARPLGVATTRPEGKESVKERPVRVVEVLGLATVNESVVVALSGMVAAPKDLAMVGGEATERSALAALPVPPLVEVTELVVLA